jgi:hypothetical protein
MHSVLGRPTRPAVVNGAFDQFCLCWWLWNVRWGRNGPFAQEVADASEKREEHALLHIYSPFHQLGRSYWRIRLSSAGYGIFCWRCHSLVGVLCLEVVHKVVARE